ncbi:MAG: RidA family protein [Candidatus Dormibacteraceae bacterium]
MTDRLTAGGHVRVRPFNTKDTYPDQRLDNDLCQAVIAGNTIYLRGQVAQDLDTSANVAVGDPAGQARKIMQNVKQLLEECGAGLEHIVRCDVYLTNIADRAAVYREIGLWLKGVYPVFTGVVVTALARPEWLVEVTAIAVLPDSL